MPTYDYICQKCGHTFEKFQSMKDDALTVCPEELCQQKKWGKGEVKRAIGAGAGLLFKGSGFYITDYRSDNYKSGAKKDAPKSSDGVSSKSEKKSTSSKSSSSGSSGPKPSKS